jgi:hypothetical protein
MAAHRAAVANTLAWAEESAARGDYANALAWLSVLDAIRETLREEYEVKRLDWRRVLVERHGPQCTASRTERQPRDRLERRTELPTLRSDNRSERALVGCQILPPGLVQNRRIDEMVGSPPATNVQIPTTRETQAQRVARGSS